MTTRAGKTVYPDGPRKAKYPEGDCRHIAGDPSMFKRLIRYIKQNLDMTARAQKRRDERRPDEETRVLLKIDRTALKNHIRRNRRRAQVRRHG